MTARRVEERLQDVPISITVFKHANVNQLTSIREVDPLTGMTRYSGIPVSLHPGPAAPR